MQRNDYYIFYKSYDINDKEKHPKLYTYCMETLGLRKLYEWVAENKPKSQTLYTSKKEFDNRLWSMGIGKPNSKISKN